MRTMRLWRLGPVVGLAGLAVVGGASPVGAQDRHKVEIVPNMGSADGVMSVAFSRDGRHVLAGGYDSTLRLWDSTTGRLLRSIRAHAGVTSVAFSPDGKRLLSASWDTRVKLWDAETGQLLRTFKGHANYVRSIAFLPDGTHVLSGSDDGTLKLWHVETGLPVRTLQDEERVISVAVSPDGTFAVSGTADGSLKLWHLATGRLLRAFDPPRDTSGDACSVAFSPDGKWVVSACNDKILKLWDTETGKLVRRFVGHTYSVNSVAVSPDGKRVLSGDQYSLVLWDVATGGVMKVFRAHSSPIRSVAFSPDGERALSGGLDNAVNLWDPALGSLLRTFKGVSLGVSSVAFLPDDTRLVSGSEDGTVKLWDAKTGRQLHKLEAHSGRVLSVAASRDGSTIVSGSADGTLSLWDAATAQRRWTVKVDASHQGGVRSVAISPDSTRLLSCGDTIQLWDVATEKLLHTFANCGGLMAFSPDGTRILAVGEKGFQLWDATTWQQVTIFSGGAQSVAFSPDGARLLISCCRNEIRLLDFSTGRLLHKIVGHEYRVHPDDPLAAQVSGQDITEDTWVAFSPDGASLLSGSWDSTLKLWDAASGLLLRTFEGHLGEVTSVAFSYDGKRVISGSADGTTRVWDAATGEQLAVLMGDRDGEWLGMTPKGFFAGSDKGSEMLSVVRGLESYSVMQFYDQLYRPDLVEEALKGDPQGTHKDAAYHLNLEKILDSGPAPRVEHLEKKTERAGDTIKLAVRIVDEGGGIGSRVVWRVNGQTQGRTEPVELKGAQAPSQSAFTLTETFRIDASKENIVELTAYNGAGLLATPPYRITIDKFGATTEERPRMHVLAIGVDKYRMPDLELKYAVKDTLEFSKALGIVGSTLFAKVETTTLTNEQVTETAIASAFDRIGSDAKIGDVFVLYLAGHGKSIEGKYYYYPQTLDIKAGQTVEKHGIGQDKWQAWLAKVGHVQKPVLILDTCYAGAAAVLVRGDDSARQTAIDQLKHATGQNLIAASRQAAYEGYQGHGVLTWAVLEALHKTNGSGSDDTILVGHLAEHVNRRVPEITQELFHQKQWPIRRLSGNDFPIGIRQGVLRPGIPKTPTHVLIRTERVRERPASDALSKLNLSPGTLLRLVEEEAGWAVIARDGERLGYVPAEALLEISR